MSERMLRGLIAAFGALVLLWAGISLASGGSSSTAGDGQELTRTFARIAGGTLEGLSISAPDGATIEISRGEDGWKVNGFRADSQAIQRVRDALDAARVTGIAGRNAANHERFGVADDSTWTVSLRTADDSARFLIGDAGPGFSTAFIRLPGRDEVFEVNGNLRSALARVPADWRDRTIARVDTALIESLLLERDGAKMTLTRADSAWTLDGASADGAGVAQLLGALARLDASGFADDTVTTSDAEQRRLVALRSAADTLVSLAFFGREFDWFVRAAGDPVLYRIGSYTVDRLIPERDALIEN